MAIKAYVGEISRTPKDILNCPQPAITTARWTMTIRVFSLDLKTVCFFLHPSVSVVTCYLALISLTTTISNVK